MNPGMGRGLVGAPGRGGIGAGWCGLPPGGGRIPRPPNDRMTGYPTRPHQPAPSQEKRAPTREHNKRSKDKQLRAAANEEQEKTEEEQQADAAALQQADDDSSDHDQSDASHEEADAGAVTAGGTGPVAVGLAVPTGAARPRHRGSPQGGGGGETTLAWSSRWWSREGTRTFSR